MLHVLQWPLQQKQSSSCKSVVALLNAFAMLLKSLYVCFSYPLFAFTPVASGGLGLQEAKIGAHMAFRSLNAVVAMFFYTPIERRLGVIKTYRLSLFFIPVCVLFLPLLNAMARAGMEDTWLFNSTVGLFFTTWSIGNFGWSMF